MDDMEACDDWSSNTDGHTELDAGPAAASGTATTDAAEIIE
jgi:hypothetical protein